MGYCVCNTLKGTSTDCSGSLGGLKAVYITHFKDDLYTISGDSVTSFKSGTTWAEYAFRAETASFTSSLNKTSAGGVYVTTEINLVFPRMDAAKRAEMNALSLDDLAVIAVDNNGVYHAFGRWLPVTATAGTGETGTAYGDNNQYTMTLTAADPDFGPMLSLEAIATLKSSIDEVEPEDECN